MAEIFDVYGSGFENDNSNKPLSVMGAKRIHNGKVTVLGTIVSVSEMYILEVKSLMDSTRKELRDAKSIQLEDTETLDESERLDVILFDDMVSKVRAGEVVIITGDMKVEDKKGTGKSQKKINVLYASSIKHVNRKHIIITEKDINGFHRFAKLPDLIQRLASMIAPNVIGYDNVKIGLLRSIVGGVDHGKKSGGRIDTLLVGDPGTSKSTLAREVTEIKPNSRFVSAPHASTRTLTAIVEKENETFMLRLGALPLSKGAICAINEIASFTLEDQSRLLDVLQEGQFPLDKHGRHYDVSSPTTVIATANPVHVTWSNSQIISNNEIELRKNLIDRFSQIYAFRDNMGSDQTKIFVRTMDEIRQRKPHNYNFLRKYLLYVCTIDVKVTRYAQNILNEFWVEAKSKGLLGVRMYLGLFKIAEAQAKLQLKDEVDEEIANQAIESVSVMIAQYGPTVNTDIGPREVAYKAFLEVLQNTQAGITIEELCKTASKEKPKIVDYLGNIRSIKENHKLRSVITLLLNNSNVKRIGINPLVLKWSSDVGDSSDTDHENNNSESKIEIE